MWFERHPKLFIVLIGALAAIPPMSMDMGLPGLTQIETGLGATHAQATYTLSAFLYGFAISQLFVGPLSDRYGRKPILICGLFLYTISGIACAMAPSPEFLLAMRTLSGMGGAVGTTLALAIIRDLYSEHEMRVKMASISTFIAIAPVLAPSLGVLMLSFGGWRMIYVLLGISGLLMLALTVAYVDESRPVVARNRVGLISRYRTVSTTKRTFGCSVANALSFAGLFLYIGASPLILIGSLGVSVSGYGFLFALTAAGMFVGAWCNKQAAKRQVRWQTVLTATLWIAVAAPAIASVLAMTGHLTLITLLPCMFISCFCRGVISPNANHAALEHVPQHAGAASAMLGCLQNLMGAASGLVVAVVFPWLDILGITLSMAALGGLALLAWHITEAQERVA